jgi:phosphatidylinositol-bisphosphatase
MNDIEVLSYDSYPAISLSDHKPVACTLTMKIYTVIQETRERMQNELLRELDGLENEALPDLKVVPEGIEFNFLNSSSSVSSAAAENESGNAANLVVNGGELVGSSIELTNIKKFLVAWQLVPKNGESGVCEDWLKISQLSGNLAAGSCLALFFFFFLLVFRRWSPPC